MILADTSIWISFLRKDDQDTFEVLKAYLKKEEVMLISPIIGELLQGAKSQREVQIIETLWESLPRLDEHELFIEAGMLSQKHHFFHHGVGLIDMYILAAAKKHQLAIWTLDKKLEKAASTVLMS